MTDSLYAQRYRLVEALPPGRALAVHRALDSQGRTVRITVLRPFDADAFQRQMGAVAAARHLDLPAVFDVGRDGSDCYVVTEDVEGTDALALVARGAPPVSDASMIGAQAAAGLAALHAQGVVHGGIGPEQVVPSLVLGLEAGFELHLESDSLHVPSSFTASIIASTVAASVSAWIMCAGAMR